MRILHEFPISENSFTTGSSDGVSVSVGVVCYELLFGCPPSIKAVQNRPETSLAMKLIALREEIIGMKKKNQVEEEENDDEQQEEDGVIQKLLTCNELLCRFLLLSLSTLPLDRPTSSECVAMFEQSSSGFY